MALKFQDYYETLGVARAASADEIKQAFRQLARLHHPDVAKNKVTGEAKFKEINEAYEVLSDPEKRRRYDELGANWQEGGGMPFPPGGGYRSRPRSPQGAPDFEFGGTGFSQSAGRTGGDEEAFAHQGQDVEADLLVTLEEVLRGSRRKVTLRRPGMDGEVERTNTYQVRIPPGVREGQRIRLAGQGGAGFGGGAAGDLYLRVRLARHPDFSVQASDLYCDLDLAPWEAVLGVQAKIPTLDGPTTLRVPPGTAAGSQLRLRGLGLPREDGTRGDLYAAVRIHTPGSVSAEERALWEQLAGISKFKPRSES
jgi:curved DNA-binding protein